MNCKLIHDILRMAMGCFYLFIPRMSILLNRQNYKKIGLVGQFWGEGRTTKESIKSITIVSILFFSTSSYTLIRKYNS